MNKARGCACECVLFKTRSKQIRVFRVVNLALFVVADRVIGIVDCLGFLCASALVRVVLAHQHTIGSLYDLPVC